MHRRRVLVGLVALVAAACGVRRPESPQSDPTSDAGSPPPDEVADDTREDEPRPGDDDPPSELPPAPDPAPPYEPVAAETHPNAKALGAAIAQAVTTYDPQEPLEEIVARASDGRGDRTDVEAARPLHHPDGWSRGQVLYPQFGGLTDDECSIMAVVSQRRGLPDGSEVEEVRTVDVRLRLDGGEWVFDAFASAGGEPVERPGDLPTEAAAVLDDDRIELPDSARWDIHRGVIDVALLDLMHRLADETDGYAVCVLESGHPINVFGTDRLSDHTRGRAVDIHRIGDHLVIDDRGEGSLTDRTVAWLYDDPSEPVVGSPWALDAFGGRSFTDAVHQDHLHVAISRPADEGDPPDEELAP